jgi:SH3 domain-containing YSC84-like protein 1
VNKKFIQTLCLTTALSTAVFAADMQKLDQRIEAAHQVLHELMDTPDKGIPNDIAAKATCVVVIPALKREPLLLALNMGRA